MNREAVLLLGGTGFIGSALANRLRNENRPIYIIGRQNVAELEQILPQCGTVVHLASATTPGSSATQPSLELDNLALTLRLLTLMQAQPETHLIFFSSGGTVYGNPDQIPVKEAIPIKPLSHYGAGKAAQEGFFEAFRARGNAITILRTSNVYGPGQTLKTGFGLVRTMLEHVLCGTSMEIWGDGENIRDFIFIDDVVDACLYLTSLPSDTYTYNLGSGFGYSINDVKHIVETVCCKRLEVIRRPARPGDVRSIVLDTSRLNGRLGWRPRITLAVGIERTWEWLQQQ